MKSKDPMTFGQFINALEIEQRASKEKFNEEARRPLDEQLRLGNIAGPVMYTGKITLSPFRKEIAEFTAASLFQWGKIKSESSVNIALPGEILNNKTCYNGKLVETKSSPLTFEITQGFKSEKLSGLTKGKSYVLTPPLFDTDSKSIKILKEFNEFATWPEASDLAHKVTKTKAFDACLNDNNPILAIKGPPGTGKTETLAKVALALVEKG